MYVLSHELEDAKIKATTPMQFIRSMVEKVYTLEALKSSTAQGFPPRSKGAKKLKKVEVLPALHPAGRLAILGK